MAKAANVFRKATVELLMIQLTAIGKTAGVVLKCYRDYESPAKPSKNQTEVANAASTHQSVVSGLENARSIPADPVLKGIMAQIGLNPTSGPPEALYKLLRFIRDHRNDLKGLSKHFP